MAAGRWQAVASQGTVRQRVAAAGAVDAVRLGGVLDVSGSMNGELLAIARKATTGVNDGPTPLDDEEAFPPRILVYLSCTRYAGFERVQRFERLKTGLRC